MKTKKWKIGVSLLIALFFLLPSGAILAEKQNVNEAGVTEPTESMIRSRDGGPISQGPGDPPIIPDGIFDPDFGQIYGGPHNGIPEGTYDLWTYLFIPMFNGPGCVKAFLEIYKKGCGIEVPMYETSFEDNFDIYNNWIQVDADCGVVGGHYDSFAWTDARSSDGDHSFKCSMYDIYKGNQNDYLQCLKSFDISEQSGVNISFDIWVEGSGEELGWSMGGNRLYTVYDYLDFEVSDDFLSALDIWYNPDNWWTNGLGMANDEMIFCGSANDGIYGGAYKFFDTTISRYDPSPYENYVPKTKNLGGGWWNVWWELSTAEIAAWGLNVEDIMFRFSWHSDPESQFEGAYVDNVKVMSIEDVETKVFQTHTQGPVCWNTPDDLVDDCFYIDFPLDWEAINYMECGQKETCYDFKLWFELVEGAYDNMYDWPNTIDWPVCVGDYYDCWVFDGMIETSFGGVPIIPGAGVMDYGDDMHITGWAHLQGTVPAYNVPITCKAFKKNWEQLYFNDFEGNLMGWEELWCDAAAGIWHLDDFDSWSGSKSLACFDPDTRHYHNNLDWCSILHEQSFDTRDYLELNLDYYSKWITEGTLDDYLIILYDAGTNYILGNGLPADIDSGYHPEYDVDFTKVVKWLGPDQTQCKYAAFDLMDAYDYWYTVRGMFRNPDGSQNFNIDGFGFAARSDASGYTNALAELDGFYWSGWMFDDVAVNGLSVDENNPLFTDAIIIPEMEPCEVYEVQFEWEDVPYCNYLIRMDCECEGGCDNWDYKVPWEAQVLVVGDIEKLHPKEVESIDLTGSGEGEWVISSSDTDNYLASQSEVLYPAYMDSIAHLCIDNGGECSSDPGEPCCIDISQQLADGVPVLLTFDAWWDIEGWPWDWLDMDMAFGCPADVSTDWINIDYWDGESYGWLPQGPYDLGALCTLFGETEFCLRFRFVSDSGFNFRGAKLDDFVITNLLQTGFPPVYEDFEDPCDDLDNWCLDNYHTGQYWFHKADRTGNPDDVGTYCNFFDENMDGIKDPLESTVPNMMDCLIWTTEIEDCYEAYLAFSTDYQFEAGDQGYVEIDDGSGKWWKLSDFRGTSGGWITEQKDISFLAGKSVQVRFRLITDGNAPVACDHWCIDEVTITGKQDNTPPMTTATMTGTMKESGWYNTAIQVVIKATDNVAMGEIHYILDGVETVVSGDTASFRISANGQHTLEYWGVDLLGNIEAHHIVPAFKIDSGTPPTVAITAPEPGFYLFGNKLLSASKVFIIGAFNIEATAADVDSGIYKVSFYLDGDLIAEDTAQPFGVYCALKHMGAGTIKAVAEDFAQNTAEDTLDVTYYKFL